MRLVLGIVIGGALTVGGAYVADALSSAGTKPMVNWDVVAKNLDAVIALVWVAGREWGPGWVQWRRGTQYVGWAPLPPDEIVVEYRDEPVRSRDFVAPRLVSVILPARQQDVFIHETVVVNQTIILRERGPAVAVNPGIAPAIIAAAVGRPLRTFEVRPRILAGTAQIQGAVGVKNGRRVTRSTRTP
jgi:hypothetical protein